MFRLVCRMFSAVKLRVEEEVHVCLSIVTDFRSENNETRDDKSIWANKKICTIYNVQGQVLVFHKGFKHKEVHIAMI